MTADSFVLLGLKEFLRDFAAENQDVQTRLTIILLKMLSEWALILLPKAPDDAASQAIVEILT